VELQDPATTIVLLLGARRHLSGGEIELLADRNAWRLSECETFESMVESCTARWPNVAVLDISGLPVSQHERTLRWLRREARIPTLLITAADDFETRILAVRFGTEDHAVAPVDPRELEARVRHCLDRSSRLNMRIVGDLVIDRPNRRVVRRGTTIPVTPNELAVLERLLASTGAVVSKAQLKDAMGGTAQSVNAVEVHVSSLRRKLKQAGPELIDTVHTEGYVMRPLPTFDLAQRTELLAARERRVQAREDAVAERGRNLRTHLT
jgi:DNA-binding response OmpR family regulator